MGGLTVLKVYTLATTLGLQPYSISPVPIARGGCTLAVRLQRLPLLCALTLRIDFDQSV